MEFLPSQSHDCTASIMCFERNFPGQPAKRPVKLVVFDFDETLTLVTMMPSTPSEFKTDIGPHEISVDMKDLVAWNFESPFVEGCSRVEKLKECFADLQQSDLGDRRTLAVLTKNTAGAVAVLNLLMLAGLHEYFSAVWCMEDTENNAVYKNGASWEIFTCPKGRQLSSIHNHKVDIIYDVMKNPQDWFPQLAPGGCSADGEGLRSLLDLQPENIVLVDDVRVNFQSDSPEKSNILRGVKVARYDCKYLGMYRTNMGGIGAHTVDDYSELCRFVRTPWHFKEGFGISCKETDFDGHEEHPPVKLVVLGFGHTLTVHTVMPEARNYQKKNQEAIECFRTTIGYDDVKSQDREKLIEYNFETPYVAGARISKLKAMLENISVGSDGQRRTLAVLTRNMHGAIAVLNMLMMAELAEFFSAIWTPDAEKGLANGVYRDSEGWKVFTLPEFQYPDSIRGVHSYKPMVLQEILWNASAWFPQVSSGASREGACLDDLAPCNIVLVDDERDSFRPVEYGDVSVEFPRYCKISHFDDEYRDLGVCFNMGGIGAKNDGDYKQLAEFIESPWTCHIAETNRRIKMKNMRSIIIPDTLERSENDETPHSLRGAREGTRKMLISAKTKIDFDEPDPESYCQHCSACELQ